MFESVFDFASIVLADIVLSGDNALIIGMAAASLPPQMRHKAILYGLVVAAVLRILFAVFATYLLNVPGLLFAGGLLLVWVCWRLFGEIQESFIQQIAAVETAIKSDIETAGDYGLSQRTVGQALISITVADVSMSIDNVLAVAAIARENTTLLIFGLALAIVLMGICASMIMKLLGRYPWISWAGLAILIYVAARMLYDGWPGALAFAGLSYTGGIGN